MKYTEETGEAPRQIADCKVREFYDRQVSENPELPSILGVANILAADLRDREEWIAFRKIVSLDKNMNVLELGCGGGRWCEHLAPLVGKVTGVDFSGNAIAHARKRIAGKYDNICFHHASVEEFQILERYDLIYFSAVTPYLGDETLEMCVTKYAAALKEGGMIVVRDSVTNRAHELEHEGKYGASYRTIDDYHLYFSTAGLCLTKVEKSFPLFCLSPVLSNRILVWAYRVLPLRVRTFLLALLSRCMFLDSNGTHWPGDIYSYDHLFLVFTRNFNDTNH